MAISSGLDASARREASVRHDESQFERTPGQQLCRWGAVAGLVGVLLMVASLVVVVALGLPDASDVETLTDFADIESGRIAEHFLYLGALMLFALHVLVVHRLLVPANPAAALFGTALVEFGLVMMAASSLLHVATSPLADLYTASDTPPEDLPSIEYAWHGAQSVFDTMLATGVLLVPIGIVLLGLAMRRAPAFGPRLTWLTFGLGTVGIVGAAIAVVDPGSMYSAVSVLAIVAFNLSIGWRMLKLGNEESIDRTDREPAPAG
jgi:hypothetical protein